MRIARLFRPAYWMTALVAALLVIPTTAYSWPSEFLPIGGGEASAIDWKEALAAWGMSEANSKDRWSGNAIVKVQQTGCTSLGNVIWPGEKAAFTYQFTNLTDKQLTRTGSAVVIQYEVTSRSEQFFDLGMRRIAQFKPVPFSIDIAPKGWQDVTITPDIPEAKGGFAVLLDFEGEHRLFGSGCVRTFKPDTKPRQFYRLTMDLAELDILARLGVSQNRHGISYKPTTDGDFESWYKEESQKLARLKQYNLPVCVEFGGGPFRHDCQPTGRERRWLTDKDEQFPNACVDLAWQPSYDADFTKFVQRWATDWGWPKGPVNAMKLWNEPWNGASISGWGADDERYREIYTAMCIGVENARKEGAQILLGGCDSTSNSMDKLFSDGKDTFLHRFDFSSIHYQGTSPGTTLKQWVDRKGPDGKPNPVVTWDTESWVANSDGRIAAVLSSMFAFGQDRVVGIQSDNVVGAVQNRQIQTANGKQQRWVNHTWSPGAAAGAFQHFVGERTFKELLFKEALPYVMQFNPEAGNQADEGTVVVVGDLGGVYSFDGVALRTCRSLAEVKQKEELRAQLKALPADSPERAKLIEQIGKPQIFTGCTMTLQASPRWGSFDFYGNPVPATDGKVVIPLDTRGFYLRPDGQPGGMEALLSALRSGRIEGLSPVALKAHDFQAPIESKPTLGVELINVLNRPIAGSLSVVAEGLTFAAIPKVELQAHERRIVPVTVASGAARADNRYATRFVFDCGADGTVVHEEDMRANVIAKRTITVDGKLDEWDGVIPQTISFSGRQTQTATEAAWRPFLPTDNSVKKGEVVAWIAYDADNFYFAAKVSDSTPHAGVPRYADRKHEEEDFYPPVYYEKGAPAMTNASMRWTGQVLAPATGEYTFTTISDDGIRFAIDGKELFANWTGHGATEDKGTIKLEAGKRYDIKLEYYQGGGEGSIKLLWTVPGKERAIIPTEALFTDAAATKAEGLKWEVYRGIELKEHFATKVDAKVEHTWQDGPLSKGSINGGGRAEIVWPEGVRRYSYRRDPLIPAGNFPNFDNIQLAFNVLPDEQKASYPCPPGTFKGFIDYPTTDYEYALNMVEPKYGGGFEVWRLAYPGMPSKHFYPRNQPSPADGPAKDAKLTTVYVDGARLTECAIPWSEIPGVKALLDAKKPIKFSFRANDSAGNGCMELARQRSVSKRGSGFHVDWVEHWVNEVEFSFAP